MRLEIIVFLIALAIFFYIRFVGKITIPKIGGVDRFLSIISGAWIQTALLLLLTLLTLSYAIGGREEWADSLTWWWHSKIFLPSLFAVLGIILFAPPEWRKRVNNMLIGLTGILIVFSLVGINPRVTEWWGGDSENNNNEVRNAVPPNAPQNLRVITEVKKVRKETVLAQYGAFTEVQLPPTEKLINIRWEATGMHQRGCIVAIVHKDHPEGEKLPCGDPIRGLHKVTRIGFSSGDPLGEDIPVTVRIAYLGRKE